MKQKIKAMKTKKFRIDFVSHCSVVVEVPECDYEEDLAIRIAEDYTNTNDMQPSWEYEDGGVEEVYDEEEPVNDIENSIKLMKEYDF